MEIDLLMEIIEDAFVTQEGLHSKYHDGRKNLFNILFDQQIGIISFGPPEQVETAADLLYLKWSFFENGPFTCLWFAVILKWA